MFFEAHRFATPVNNTANNDPAEEKDELAEQIPYVSQTVMLGTIPGENTKLTMIAVLSYPENCDGIYPDALETFGNKFSILSPDKNMIEKILHVAAMPPPKPSPDFWSNAGSLYVKKSNSYSHEKTGSTELAVNSVMNMPDVTGKSVRAGLQVLQHLNLDIKLVGSGRIVSQQPPAGTELIKVSKCTLQMQQEI
jgi:hypothetical protein